MYFRNEQLENLNRGTESKAKQSQIILHIDCRAGKKTIPEMKMSLDESNTRLEAGESLN